MYIGRKEKSLLALCGVAVLVGTFVVFLIPLSFLPENSIVPRFDGTASRVGNVRTTGSASKPLKGPPVDTRRTSFVEENWHWKMPETLREGDDGVLELSCSSQPKSRAGTAGDFLSEFSPVHEAGTTDIQVSVSGDVHWHTKTELKNVNGCREKAEFSWLFTANNRGDKIIQIRLPPDHGFFGLRELVNGEDENIQNQSAKVFADSIELPLYVRGPFGLSKDAELMFKLLG